MSEAILGSVGTRLRTAREAQGLTVEEVAARLRLMHRQINAMEQEDFDSLGQAVFARGFVRNYARLLGLDPEPLLAEMIGAPADTAPVVHAAPARPARSLATPWLLLLTLGLVMVAAVPVGLYWWLNSDVEDTDLVQAVAQPPQAETPAPTPVSTLSPPVAPTVAGSDTPSLAEPVPPVPAEKSAPLPASVAQGSLLLEFGDESWVEIKDASGRMLLRQLKPAGSRAELDGQPPFDLLIGNAAQVRLSYNGRPIDLKPFIDVTVARFTLEE